MNPKIQEHRDPPTTLSPKPTVSGGSASRDAIPAQEIQELAYKLYEEHGRVDGNDVRDWLEAESVLRRQSNLVV